MKLFPRQGCLIKKGRACHYAFTLLETLVCTAIVAVLLVIGISTVQTLGKRSKQLVTQNHLKSIGHALSLHTGENNGRLVSGLVEPEFIHGELVRSGVRMTRYWYNALDYYLGGKDYTLQGMRSGDRPAWQMDPLKTFPRTQLSGVPGYGVGVGFGWNHNYFGYTSEPEYLYLGWNSMMSQVSLPGRTIIVGTNEDSLNIGNESRNAALYIDNINCRRHDGGGYYLFLDGHIEKLTPEEVMANGKYLFRRRK